MSGKRPLGFTANTLVRLAEDRDETTLATALAAPGALFALVQNGRFLVRGPTERPQPWFTQDEARTLGADPAEAVLLGWTASGHAPRLAMPVVGEAAGDESGPREADLRQLGMNALLTPDDEAQLAQALHLANWHRRTRFCGLCGGQTVVELAGYRRRCLQCNEAHFPRTDPVVIMLVHDARGRCLLGRQPHFAPGIWSALAGFVETGETIEDAVRRETGEEAGIAVSQVTYRTSQPWPFPGSLMIGCHALAASSEITVQDSELEDVRWFERSEVEAMLARAHPQGLTLPPPYAIATRLAELFCEE